MGLAMIVGACGLIPLSLAVTLYGKVSGGRHVQW
jgi:hypothetical protein